MKKNLLTYIFIILLPVTLSAQINIGNNLENISYERPVEYEIAGITVEGIENLDKNGYVGFLYFTNPQSNVPNLMNSLAYTLSLKFHIPIIQAIGPNYLHSLGQLFKGGPDNGTFIQFVSSNVGQDIQVPYQNFSFYDLMSAQVQGEHKILNLIDRNPLVVNLGNEPEKKLEKFIEKLKLAGF